MRTVFILPSARLEAAPIGDMTQKVSKFIKSYRLKENFIPHVGDIHTGHTIVFNALTSATKGFRPPFTNKVLSYELKHWQKLEGGGYVRLSCGRSVPVIEIP